MTILRFTVEIPVEGIEDLDPEHIAEELRTNLTSPIRLPDGGILYMDDLTVNACSIAPDEFVEAARERHCDGSDNEIEIDEPANMSEGADGVWIQAWVFVPGIGSQYVDPEGDDEDEPCGIPF